MTCAVGTFLFTITELKMSLAVAWGVASLGEEAIVFYVVSLGDSLIADRKIQRSNEKHIQGV